MATESELARYSYILRRKEFFNQKSFDIFEKLQIGVFAYVAYIFTILTAFTKREWSAEQVRELASIADIFLVLFLAIFVVFMVINVCSWWRYEREENTFLSKPTAINYRQVLTWVECWIVFAALSETLAAHFLKNHALFMLLG